MQLEKVRKGPVKAWRQKHTCAYNYYEANNLTNELRKYEEAHDTAITTPIASTSQRAVPTRPNEAAHMRAVDPNLSTA